MMINILFKKIKKIVKNEDIKPGKAYEVHTNFYPHKAYVLAIIEDHIVFKIYGNFLKPRWDYGIEPIWQFKKFIEYRIENERMNVYDIFTWDALKEAIGEEEKHD